MTTETATTLADLLPTIADRAAEIEAQRRVPRDLLDDLVAAGCFRLLVPTSHGGTGADLVTALRTYEDLASADASVAWIVMIGGGAWVDLVTLAAGHLRRRVRHRARSHRGRRLQPGRLDHPRRRRLPRRGALGLRQRL